jgi:hypothetical protein
LKKIITAVILAVLILAAFSMLSTPRVKADTSEAKVLSYTWYEAPAGTTLAGYIGDLVAVGEIQNVGSNVIGYVDVTGIAYNSTGGSTGVLNSNEVQASGYNLLPGQKAPFYIDFPPTDSITQDNTYTSSVSTVTVDVSYVSDTNSTPYSGLTIPTGSSTSYLDSSGTFTVTGTVHNTGTATVDNVMVITTFYNTSGSVVSFNFTYLNSGSSLAPGDSAPFTATPTDNTGTLSSEITNYSLLLQSSLPLTTSSPTPSPPPSATPTSSGASTQPTQSPALISSAVTYGVAAAIVVVVVVLLALLFLRKRHKNAQFELPPPPPPPPPP